MLISYMTNVNGLYDNVNELHASFNELYDNVNDLLNDKELINWTYLVLDWFCSEVGQL